MLRRTASTISGRTRAVVLGSITLPLVFASGCFGTEYAFIEGEDVELDPVRDTQMRATAEYGDVYTLSLQSAHEVNGWVGEAVESSAEVFEILAEYPPSSKDGEWSVYGPYDAHGDEDLAWLLRIRGDESESAYEVWVGPRGSDDTEEMGKLLTGDIEIDGSRRTGAFLLDFDVVEANPDLKRGPDRDRTYRGQIDIEFERDLDSELKRVILDYHDFSVETEVPVPEYFAADHYRYDREASGAGTFSLSIVSTFQTQLWSGPERERMTLDLVWNDDGAGVGLGKVQNYEDEGDLSFGELVINECFGGDGLVTWRELEGEYRNALPGYGMGDPSSCVDVQTPARGE